MYYESIHPIDSILTLRAIKYSNFILQVLLRIAQFLTHNLSIKQN
jgi:hypothetical protein